MERGQKIVKLNEQEKDQVISLARRIQYQNEEDEGSEVSRGDEEESNKGYGKTERKY